MTALIKIQRYGNQLALIYDDGTRSLCYPAQTGFICAPGPDIAGAGGSGGENNGPLQLVNPLPSSFTGNTADGTSVTLNSTQVLRMGQIVAYANPIPGINRQAVWVAGTAAMTESSLRNLSNVTAYPETGSLPDIDGDGSDHDSVGLWQMRPSAGWGTPTECATISDEVPRFIGGPGSPNNGSPAGLFDISGWASMTIGEACQAVEVSAYPDAYDRYTPFIDSLLNAILVG